MAHKNRTLSRSGCLELLQSVSEKGGKKYLVKFNYHISINRWPKHDSLDSIFDPFGNRWSNSAVAWKFNTRKEAEELIILATLKGLAR